jgi:hypothetical protein
MKLLLEHLPASLAIGAIGWWLSGESLCLLAALAGGWMIDADHLVDFVCYLKRAEKPVSFGLLKTGGYFKLNGKVFVPMHSWEITIGLMLLAAVISDAEYILLSASIAHGLHLIQDQLLYRVRPLGYFFISRLKSNFTVNNFCRSTS